MSQDNKVCPICKQLGHSKFYCKSKPFKRINKVSVKKATQKTIKTVKPNRTKLKKQLDKLVKDYVKERDNHTCQHCLKKVSGVSCQGSHVFSVGSCPQLQFEPLNIKVLCAYCHLRWWHSSPVEASAWFAKKFPDRLEKLQELKQSKYKTTTVELQILIDEYKQKLKS